MTDIKIMVFRHSAFYTPLITAIAGGFLAKEADFFTDHSPQAVSRAIEAYQKSGTWDGDILIPKDLYDNALNVFEHAGLITRRHPYEEVVTSPPV